MPQEPVGESNAGRTSGEGAVEEPPSLQHAFNQFHANVHVGTPGTFAMDHEHDRTDIVAVLPC